MQRWFRVAAGWVLIVLGLLGLVLPFLQGILFLALGGIILSQESPWVRRQLRVLGYRYPRAAMKVGTVTHTAKGLSERFFGRKHHRKS